LLPAILGGDWAYGGSSMPWPECIPADLSAHLLWFQRRDDPPSWENCAVIGNPHRSFVDDGKVLVSSRTGRPDDRFAFGFVDKTNGDVFKSGGWKGPEKNFARGNIFDDKHGCGKVHPGGIW
jgi:hypothetical protein